METRTLFGFSRVADRGWQPLGSEHCARRRHPARGYWRVDPGIGFHRGHHGGSGRSRHIGCAVCRSAGNRRHTGGPGGFDGQEIRPAKPTRNIGTVFSFLQAAPPPPFERLPAARAAIILSANVVDTTGDLVSTGGCRHRHRKSKSRACLCCFQAAVGPTVAGPPTITIPADSLAAFDGRGPLAGDLHGYRRVQHSRFMSPSDDPDGSDHRGAVNDLASDSRLLVSSLSNMSAERAAPAHQRDAILASVF
jgi:hypothetical protein